MELGRDSSFHVLSSADPQVRSSHDPSPSLSIQEAGDKPTQTTHSSRAKHNDRRHVPSTHILARLECPFEAFWKKLAHRLKQAETLTADECLPEVPSLGSRHRQAIPRLCWQTVPEAATFPACTQIYSTVWGQDWDKVSITLAAGQPQQLRITPERILLLRYQGEP
ncbi:Hypothetical predicted protein [Pelobates cultripes]|uniref:Uncharacterized protein n=1 Tax=Pelobates cultripes TaxID=61616 RepID=A0AAD1TCG9_PELCU|nr:Hypothetical predicted protein [Pelobates cultripes]